MDQAEQLRNVIKIHNQSSCQPARVITVTSGKGGVGKSNTSVNLAVWLKKAGKRVIIFDADFGLANVEVMFGVTPTFTLADLIYNGKNIKEIIAKGPLDIDFISAGSSVVELNNLTREQVVSLVYSINELNVLYDFIIIDTGAGISDQVMEFVVASPEILLIATPDPSSLTDSYSLLKALFRRDDFVEEGTQIKVISNKVLSKEDGYNVYKKLDSVVERFLDGNLIYLGCVPSDSTIERAVRQQQMVSLFEPTAKSSKEFETIANRILEDEACSFQSERKTISHIFSKLLSRKL